MNWGTVRNLLSMHYLINDSNAAFFFLFVSDNRDKHQGAFSVCLSADSDRAFSLLHVFNLGQWERKLHPHLIRNTSEYKMQYALIISKLSK